MNIDEDPRAVKRVTNVLPAPTACPNCGGAVKLAGNSEIYGRPLGTWPYVYLCENRKACDSYVGVHPNTRIPLGTLANAQTRLARKECKPAFEVLFRNGHMGRTAAYEWLAGALGIPLGECHFGWFDITTCRKARQLSIARITQ